MIKVYNMFEINNKASVCLEKAVFGEMFQPVVHIMNGVKILPGSMYNYFSFLCFYGNDLRSGNEYIPCLVSTGILVVMEL